MADPNIDVLNLRANQAQQQLDQYRVNIYNLELRFELLNRMLEEKGIFAKEEFKTRWPLYLKNDVGSVGADGVMPGELMVTFYEGGEA